MTPEAQRITLAELDGYERCDPNPCLKSQLLGFKNKAWKCVPDYLHDLNAIHELECLLTMEQSATYEKVLDTAVNRDFLRGESIRIDCTWHATASQRAEALLRTLGRWKEDE